VKSKKDHGCEPGGQLIVAVFTILIFLILLMVFIGMRKLANKVSTFIAVFFIPLMICLLALGVGRGLEELWFIIYNFIFIFCFCPFRVLYAS
jgi:hypothetical protein